MAASDIEWDQDLIEKYDRAGPRYTSYPTALEFNENFRHADFVAAAKHYPARPLSLYLHIPFCHQLCYFCGCNKQVTRQQHKAEHYIQRLLREITELAPLFRQRNVTQIHFGGGTPTFLDNQQIAVLMTTLQQAFKISSDAEMSIEIDPRNLDARRLDFLRNLGFNRLSMGIQDFDKLVQQKINRVQDEAAIYALVQRARVLQFHSVSVDLIYGLPGQSCATFSFTLEKVIALSPDRLSVFNYAHLPSLFAAQRRIKESELPSPSEKLNILQLAIDKLTQHGYLYIGMDHFAKQQDTLAIAKQRGELNRNFQGYTTQKNADLLGLGVSAISMLGDSYAQNHKVLAEWHRRVERDGSALWRGILLNRDDCIRRDVIKALICHFALDITAIEQQWDIDFNCYFRAELQALRPMEQDGLLSRTSDRLEITAKGRLLARNVCMCFDRYLQSKMHKNPFSRVI